MSLDVYLCPERPECPHCNREFDNYYEANITHNVNKMAEAAGIYKELWRPEEIGVETAGQLIEPLTAGLARLKADPAKFIKHNPSNGWGTYDGFVPWVEAYLEACKQHPNAIVRASR